MPRPYELIAKWIAGKATIIHDGPMAGTTAYLDGAHPLISPLYRRTYRGEERPHLKPNKGRVTMTIAGIIALDDDSKIVVQTQSKGNNDPVTVLLAEVSGGKLKVFCREISIPKVKDPRKANISRLRRNNRDGVKFYVWTRDQYRFTIRKGPI